MKRTRSIAALTLTAALLLTGCGGVEPYDPFSLTPDPVPVIDVADTAKSEPAANGLNEAGADTVRLAAENDFFEMDGDTFVNNVGGYRVNALGLELVDMGDATYRATLADDSTRLEIFTQALDVGDGSAESVQAAIDSYLNYSNRFKESEDDCTVISDETLQNDDERTVYRLIWDRPALQHVEQDRRHYAIVEFIEDARIYSFFLSSTDAIDTADLDTIVESFETFGPKVEAKDYPRTSRSRDDLNAETQAFYDATFGDDAGFTWGIYEPRIDEDDITELENLQNELDYHFDIALHYSNIRNPYKEGSIYDTLNMLWENGTVTELTMQTQLYDAFSRPSMVYEILNGDYDEYLHAYAADIARFGHPVLFRPFNEMNGDWCNYSAYWTSRDTSIYVDLYRYIYSIFEEEGANANTLWIWNPNERSFPNFAWNAIDNYYPGDEYVDIVGITGYNTGTYYEGETWRSFTEIYDPIMARMETQYFQPMMITEFSCSSTGGDKAAWIEDMFSAIQEHPRLKAAIWWDGCDRDSEGNIARSYFIDDSPKVLQVFKDHLAGTQSEEDTTSADTSAPAEN